MIHFDRRRWLRSLCLAIGGWGVSRLLHAQAIDALAPFDDRAALLRALADWLLSRRY